MSELFGLTRPAVKAVGDMLSDYRQTLPATGRRTRRVWPSGGGAPRLVKNGTYDKIGGPSGVGGISHEVLCYFVDADGRHSSDEDERVTVNFASLHGLVFPWLVPSAHYSVSPAHCAYVVPWIDGKFKAISGGVTMFMGDYAAGMVDTTAWGSDNSPDVVVVPFCDLPLAEDTGVAVFLSPLGGLVASPICCPGTLMPVDPPSP